MSTEYANAVYLKSFATIVSLYQEKRDVGGLEPMVLDPSGAQPVGISPKPSISDFICDVDLAVTRTLDPQETRFFAHWFKSLKADPASEPGSHVDKTVRIKLGKALIDRGIYPIKTYLGLDA